MNNIFSQWVVWLLTLGLTEKQQPTKTPKFEFCLVVGALRERQFYCKGKVTMT